MKRSPRQTTTTRIIMIASLAGVCASAKQSEGAALFGWADEFLSGWVHCSTIDFQCTLANHWGGTNWIQGNISDADASPTWGIVGQQGANATGRANARAKVMVTFRDLSSTSAPTVTVTLSRSRTSTPGVEGTACTSGIPVGSVSQTFDGGGNPADTKINNRLLPVMDFSLDFSAPGVTMGYIETLAENGGMGTATRVGCYRIVWL